MDDGMKRPGAFDLVGDDLPTWQGHARCLDADPAAFFPDRGEQPDAGLAICQGYPVREPCLDLALVGGFDDGVWGGTTPNERKRLRAA